MMKITTDEHADNPAMVDDTDDIDASKMVIDDKKVNTKEVSFLDIDSINPDHDLSKWYES